MSQFAIFVTIKLKPGNTDAFRALILENAEAAIRDEEVLRAESMPRLVETVMGNGQWAAVKNKFRDSLGEWA